jgi:hypothetical protein
VRLPVLPGRSTRSVGRAPAAPGAGADRPPHPKPLSSRPAICRLRCSACCSSTAPSNTAARSWIGGRSSRTCAQAWRLEQDADTVLFIHQPCFYQATYPVPPREPNTHWNQYSEVIAEKRARWPVGRGPAAVLRPSASPPARIGRARGNCPGLRSRKGRAPNRVDERSS